MDSKLRSLAASAIWVLSLAEPYDLQKMCGARHHLMIYRSARPAQIVRDAPVLPVLPVLRVLPVLPVHLIVGGNSAKERVW